MNEFNTDTRFLQVFLSGCKQKTKTKIPKDYIHMRKTWRTSDTSAAVKFRTIKQDLTSERKCIYDVYGTRNLNWRMIYVYNFLVVNIRKKTKAREILTVVSRIKEKIRHHSSNFIRESKTLMKSWRSRINKLEESWSKRRFLSHGWKPEVNISLARTVASPTFSNKLFLLVKRY